MADSFLKSIRPISILDAVAQYAMVLPSNCPRTQVLSGMTVSAKTEGHPAVATKLGLAAGDLTRKQVAAVVALSNELAKAGNNEAFRLLRDELVKQTARASNAAILDALTATSASAGTTVKESLAAGLDAMDDCAHVVVACTFKQARELALAPAARPSGPCDPETGRRPCP